MAYPKSGPFLGIWPIESLSKIEVVLKEASPGYLRSWCGSHFRHVNDQAELYHRLR